MSAKPLGVAVIGAGTVGGGVVEILKEKSEMLATRTGCELKLVKVADLNLDRLRELGLSEDQMTDSAEAAINDPEVDVVAELIGGTGFAYNVVEMALNAGKGVVTANKALLAERGDALFKLAAEKDVPLCFEAAVAGAIPIIRSIRDAFVADRIKYLFGIVNGTCNYILTQMLEEGQSYEDALADAQKLGYAEADPTFDVEGNDSGHKLTLLSALGFDTQIDYNQLNIEGISKLSLSDVRIAEEMGYIVKLLAVARPVQEKLFLSVHPALVCKNNPLSKIRGSMNAVSLYGDAVMESMLCGRGAGDLPTASAVISDIAEIGRAHATDANVSGWHPKPDNRFTHAPMEDYECRFFLRFTLKDEFGVLGKIATILGENQVSIASVVQKEGDENSVPLVIVTHSAREGDIRKALKTIQGLDFITAPTGVLRLEE
ncbi:MAG: homoserine dehydrogenase [Planctomycetota bacterium]|jgi:homoserine dehydrogenase